MALAKITVFSVSTDLKAAQSYDSSFTKQSVPLVVLARALVGVKSEEPCSAVVMLEYDGLESVTRQKRTRVLLLE